MTDVDGRPDLTHLPRDAYCLYPQLVASKGRGGTWEALFIDPQLSSMWREVGRQIAITSRTFEACQYFVGCVLNPLDLYAKTGTVDRPTFKVRVRARQGEAADLIGRAATLSRELLQVLNDIGETTPYAPCELGLLRLVRKTTGLELSEVSSYYDGIPVRDALLHLAEALEKHPSTGNLFAEVPGMASQKAGWRDWIREAKESLQNMERIYGAPVVLREADWLALCKVMVSPAITRDAVHDALR